MVKLLFLVRGKGGKGVRDEVVDLILADKNLKGEFIQ